MRLSEHVINENDLEIADNNETIQLTSYFWRHYS